MHPLHGFSVITRHALKVNREREGDLCGDHERSVEVESLNNDLLLGEVSLVVFRVKAHRSRGEAGFDDRLRVL